jgi:hypothetical protein
MGKTHIEAFLSHLATQGQVSAPTQKQALNAIIFLYRHVLDQSIAPYRFLNISPINRYAHCQGDSPVKSRGYSIHLDKSGGWRVVTVSMILVTDPV